MAPLVPLSTLRVVEFGSSLDLRAEYCKILTEALELYTRLPWQVLQHMLVALAVVATALAIMGISAVVAGMLLQHRWLKRRTFNGVLILLQIAVLVLYFILDARRNKMSLVRHGIGSETQLQTTVSGCSSRSNFPHPRYSKAYSYN
eukprot:IDg19586t1